MIGNLTGDNFKMNREKAERVADLAGTDIDTVREWCLDYDWPEGREHQNWLRDASADEIAIWLVAAIQAQ